MLFNSPSPESTPLPTPSPQPGPTDHSHLAEAKDKIDALKAGEGLSIEIDAACFNELWVAYKNERRNRRQGGLQKLNMDYDSAGETMTVTNTEKEEPAPVPAPVPRPAPAPAPVDPVEPDSPVFPEPDNG
jgi:hypothetical protein